MSSTTANSLPEEFLLHIRSSRKGAWTHYVLVRKTIGSDGKNRLALSPHSTLLVPPTEPIHMGTHDHHKYEYVPELMNISFVSHTAATVVVASFLRNSATVQVHAATPKTIPILYTHKYRELLGPRLRANFTDISPAITELVASFATGSSQTVVTAPVASPAITATPAPLTIPSPTTGLSFAPPPLSSVPSIIAGILGQNTIEHVPAPTTAKVKKVKASKPTIASPAAATGPRRGDLAPFVAKQLLALAKLRHDQCPIIAEEYSDGNTAVMPCGHLFAQIAIEETFKKTPNTCPACRATGRPTYV